MNDVAQILISVGAFLFLLICSCGFFALLYSECKYNLYRIKEESKK